MKKYLGVLIFAVGLAAPSFAAEHLVTRSVKVVAKDIYKVTKTTAKDTGRGTGAALKFLF